MSTTTMIHVRVEEQVKKRASDALETMGLSISDTVRVFLTHVATEKRIPFALRVPNAETRAAKGRAVVNRRFRRELRIICRSSVASYQSPVSSGW